jgi:DNA helicase HerA-like ATPase
MATDSQSAKVAPDASSVPMLVEEKSADVGGIPIPVGMPVIGKVVHWEGTPTFTDAAALLDAQSEVKPGQFVGVWHGNRGIPVLTVLQVANCREVNPNEEPELAVARDRLGLSTRYAKEGVSTRIFRLLEGPTIEELNIEVTDNGFAIKGEPQAAELLVRAGDTVVTLTDELVAQTIGSLPDPDSGLQLGSVYGDKTVPVVFKPEMLQMHIGDFGNPGKGKSYSSGVLMEEALKWAIPTLVLDINGEMLDAARALGGRVITLPDSAIFGLSLSLITSSELIQIAPNVQEGTVYAELIELSHERLKTEKKGQPFSFDELIAKMTDTAKQNDVKGPSLGIAISRVRALEKDPIVGGSFDFIRELETYKLVVLDCRFLSVRQTRLIGAAAARELQRKGREMSQKVAQGDKAAAGWFALFMVDEAHVIAPNDEHVVSTQVMFELARMGRHVRTGLVLISQSPSDLNVSVLKRLQTRLIFALEKDQLRAIQGVTADLDERLLAKLPKLPRGVCAVSGSSEIVRHGFLMKIRGRETPVGGSTPKVFAGRKKQMLKKEGK